MSGRLYVIATPIGNLEDLSLRAARLLCEAAVIYAEDTRRTRVLIQHAMTLRPGASMPRLVALFDGNEAASAQRVVADVAAGLAVGLVSDAGTPSISDPGQRVVRAVAEAGLRVEIIPGPSAAIAAVVASGLPSERFLFVGFLPRDHGARQQELALLAAQTATMIFYEAPDRVAQTVADMAAAWGDRAACLSREISKLHEEHVRLPLSALAAHCDAGVRGECVIVVQGGDGAATSVAPVELQAQIRALLAQGLGPKDVAARLLITTGQPRRVLYQLALSLARGDHPNS
ncbi:MAG: 16S rRNA (cytidine(1402)-2'-O)-methyltransferase [Myxococcales bacterium]|nr:16S rRNA (cytidine(1402)-2'-O)-methyltransferase [Myxococcales bacterium]